MADVTVTSNDNYIVDVDNDNNATDKAFKVTHDNGTELIRVQEDGRVGIGTTSPSAKLHIAALSVPIFVVCDTGQVCIGTTNPPTYTMLELVNTTDIAQKPQIDLVNKTDIDFYDPAIRFKVGSIPAEKFILGVDDDDSDKFKISAGSSLGVNDRMVIDASGKVGIGTSSPQNRLDVEGGTVIGATYSGSNTSPANGLLVEGNVGIGASVPGAKLHVTTDGDVVSIFEDNDNPIILLKDADGGADLKYAGLRLNSNLLGLGKMPDTLASFTDIMTIDTNTGKIGIGTTAPGVKLHVKTSGDIVSIFEDDDNPSIILKDANAGADLKYAGLRLNSNLLCLGKMPDSLASFTDIMAINTSNNNVGIGTTSPARKLFVSGDAGGTTQWYNDSDAELKSNIKTIDNALDKIVKLRGVNFEWKDKENRPKGLQIGLLAQEVKGIVPEVVEKKGDYYSLATANLVALLIEAVKEQQSQIEKLKKEIELIVSEK